MSLSRESLNTPYILLVHHVKITKIPLDSEDGSSDASQAHTTYANFERHPRSGHFVNLEMHL